MKTTLCTALITALCTVASVFATPEKASKKTSAYLYCPSALPVSWDCGLPDNCLINTEEISPDPKYTTKLPTPDHKKPIFSRFPHVPHIDSTTGNLIMEYFLPPLCHDGCSSFWQQHIALSDDGKTLTVLRYRIQAPSQNPAIFCTRTQYKTETPFVFRRNSNVLLFTKSAGTISSLDAYAIIGDKKKQL